MNKETGSKENNLTVDLLVVGSGTGMAAALAAHELGLDCLVIEKTKYVGGSTARSGGAFWIPANPVLLEEGSKDNLQKAEEYLEAIVGDDSPAPRWKSFLENGSAAVEMLLRTTPMKFFWAKGYSDYHPHEPGGDALGRSCECKPFDTNRLGKEKERFRPGVVEAPFPMPVTGYDYKWMNLMLRKPLKSFPIIFKRVGQGVGGKIFGKDFVAGGQALAAGMFAGLIEAGVPVWTNTALQELVKDGDKITGAVVEKEGQRLTVHARRGVVLAAGGFDHNMVMRHKYQSPSLLNHVSLGAEGNTGDAIQIGETTGGEIALMRESWWFPAVAPTEAGGQPQVLLAERSLPGSFLVNEEGKRFINEATDYMSFGQQLLDREAAGNQVKEMWLVFDQTYRNRYLLAGSVYPRAALPEQWYKAGIAHNATDSAELAEKIGVPEENFIATLSRFNEMASRGKDEDFQRGDSAYDQYYGDPTVKPNPNLRPLDGKLYAVKVVLSDLGTCGGLVADEHGRVLNQDGAAIEGLYAMGNTAANAFGRTYPGAGGTIGQGLVYGYIIAKHVAGS